MNRKVIVIGIVSLLTLVVIGTHYFGVKDYKSPFCRDHYRTSIAVTFDNNRFGTIEADVYYSSMIGKVFGGPKIQFIKSDEIGPIIGQDVYSLKKSKGKYLVEIRSGGTVRVELNEEF